MSFWITCCIRVELEEEKPVVDKPKGKINSTTVMVLEDDPIPIPKTVAVKIQPSQQYSSTYQSFRDKDGFPDDLSNEDTTSSDD